MLRHSRSRIPVVTLLAVVGSAMTPAAFAGTPQDATHPSRIQAPQAPQSAENAMFIRVAKARGMTVANSASESLGTIDDLVIDRGSGRVAYIVLRSGAILGLGGKDVVVPYSSLGWDDVEKHVTLNATKEQIKAWPEFNADRWAKGSRDEDSLARSLANQYYPSSDTGRSDGSRQAGSEERIVGRVTRIDRRSNTQGRPEELLVTVVSEGNKTDQVIIGPSWYTSGNGVYLHRDAPIDLRVAREDRAGESVLVARSVTMNNREVPMYDAGGRPMWLGSASESKGAFITTPFVLAREVEGKSVDCRGEKCGKVSDIIFECTSGSTSFISIDPDQNLLGIGDTKRLVPWTVITALSKDAVMIDASRTMITNAPPTPSDLKELSANGMYRGVYKGYDIPVPAYERTRQPR